ncbi:MULTISPECIES: ANTAR domain-containing response regulator [Pseudomonas]|uniref:ANTAR domain-containing response regulator n=1 Tax=Pseudomonas TaxID=286 RepID=UPI000D82F8D6|nr:MULTISPECIES: ANTAR domain-containing protein [Pseudomonas]MBI6921098.1 ANTAR domain-containing protein [Pseudomonas monteilii]MCE0936295.1 ANTAR domain-containing protein [Pseudomonas kurunegalensis]MDD2137512.1 ANTAR domain-containing protein [Pseudomonas kurunegalensis]PYG72038.1 AmiR/NasT family two-component response regulator [Pseudomonas sp. RV120224-01c]PYG76422.1 AmiR/NasT family two-component response regulator [Pseudomonas sp. RV120224-01b]
MSTSNILNTLRELHVGIVCPPSEITDALVLQLMRIGCSVKQHWPPPKAFDTHTDLVFCGVFEGRHHGELGKLLAQGGVRLTAVALVEYESPTILSQILELGCHGVIVLPLDSHKVLPALVCARSNSEAHARLMQKNAQLQERLEHQADINKAKVLLMAAQGWQEPEAHAYLSKEAMKQRLSMLEMARKTLKQFE